VAHTYIPRAGELEISGAHWPAGQLSLLGDKGSHLGKKVGHLKNNTRGSLWLPNITHTHTHTHTRTHTHTCAIAHKEYTQRWGFPDTPQCRLYNPRTAEFTIPYPRGSFAHYSMVWFFCSFCFVFFIFLCSGCS